MFKLLGRLCDVIFLTVPFTWRLKFWFESADGPRTTCELMWFGEGGMCGMQWGMKLDSELER